MEIWDKWNNTKYPLEEAGVKVLNSVAYAIKQPVKFIFEVPSDKYERQYKIMVLTGLFFILIGWTLIAMAEFHVFGLGR